MSYAWCNNAIASEPRRFDVPVFEYNDGWLGKPPKDINYIKRLTGLPGDQIMISGGDLFLWNKKDEKYNIIRKWQERGDALQDELWFPVSRAFEPRYSDPYPIDPKEAAALIAKLQTLQKDAKANDVMARLKELKIDVPSDLTAEDLIALLNEALLIKGQLRDLKFPWTGAEEGVAGAKLEEKALVLDGSAPIDLKFKFPITNVYLKQGRWDFRHIGCPSAHLRSLEGIDGAKWRNPHSTTEDMSAVVANTWDGVQCPNCKHILFPIKRWESGDREGLIALGSTPFLYGGQFSDGDMKLEMKLDAESFGSLQLEVGNATRRAVWNIPGGGETDDGGDKDKLGRIYYVQNKTAALAPGTHTLMLAYVDGTVIASLDGKEIDRRPLDVAPLSLKEQDHQETIVRAVLTGVKGRITEMNVARDLFYTTVLQSTDQNSTIGERAAKDNRPNHDTVCEYYEYNNLVIKVEEGSYLMMGDNSPSSSDSRVWGRVPRERILGRAWVVGWPISHWKVIK